MVTSAMETASTLDQATLDALQESVSSVLAEQCGSTELHAFIDGKNTLDKTLWAQAGQLGWLGFGIPEQYGGLGMGAQGLAILYGELGRQSVPGPYIATLSAAQAIVETGGEAIRQTWLPRLASGEVSAAVPAHWTCAAWAALAPAFLAHCDAWAPPTRQFFSPPPTMSG
jgi:alkylation response protein AidB-like acyl-CoA dehydrogenase